MNEKFKVFAKEWHPKKNNNLTPNDVSPGSKKIIWWRCKKGHEWKTTPNSRTSKKTGCPECAGTKVGKDNNLKKIHPRISKEWHPIKNLELTPNKVMPGSKRKVWWQCSKKNHEWEAVIYSRLGSIKRKGTGCPHCKKERQKHSGSI